MKSFADLAKIKVKAGDGGDGVVSFRREKYVPKGGPDGGDGGDGGSVKLQTDPNLASLYDFTHQHKFIAEDGGDGKGQKKKGRGGKDLTLKVPVGTVVYEYKNPETPQAELIKIVDLSREGEVVQVAQGGKGGRGNTAFKSSTNQAPREAEPGTPGEERLLVLELKLIADVGLVGLPNAGKSTLLSHLTAAKPKIGEYPFTTLSPNLGVTKIYGKEVVLADIPGLIEGAAKGKGLGDEFLRHIERTRVLVHLIDPSYREGLEAYEIIREELGEYSDKLLDKPELVVVNKIDLPTVAKKLDDLKRNLQEKYQLEVVAVSAVTGQNLDKLKERIFQMLEQAPRKQIREQDQESVPVYKIDDLKSY